MDRATFSAWTTALFTPGIGITTRLWRCGWGTAAPGRICSWRADEAYWWRMNIIIAISVGMKMRTIHAPLKNFSYATTRKTTPVRMAPNPLTRLRHAQPELLSLRQWMTMPACDSVKQMKTPTE